MKNLYLLFEKSRVSNKSVAAEKIPWYSLIQIHLEVRSDTASKSIANKNRISVIKF